MTITRTEFEAYGKDGMYGGTVVFDHEDDSEPIGIKSPQADYPKFMSIDAAKALVKDINAAIRLAEKR
jgi:hypothetical protein